MSFNIQSLRQKAKTKVFSEFRKAAGSQVTATDIILENNRQRLFESKNIETDAFDIFLSHSSEDADIVLGILDSLNNYGYSVYIDWVTDSHLDRSKITKNTIDRLRTRMQQSKSLFYATTKHSSESKWMPWELGYMDGDKSKAAILPVFKDETSSTDNFEGQEYLGAYPFCIEATDDKTHKNRLWICEASDIYVSFDKWLKGKKPINH